MLTQGAYVLVRLIGMAFGFMDFPEGCSQTGYWLGYAVWQSGEKPVWWCKYYVCAGWSDVARVKEMSEYS